MTTATSASALRRTAAATAMRTSRGGRWMAVGALGFVVQVAVIRLMVSPGGLPIPLATAVGVTTAVFHNFWWHERWTWRERTVGQRSTRWQRLTTFCGASAVLTLAGNVALTTVLTSWLGVDVGVANLLAVLVLAAGNWLVSDRLVFGVRATGTSTACLAIFASLAGVHGADAAELRPQTVAAWDAVIEGIEARMRRELANGQAAGHVSWPTDEATLRTGAVFVERIADNGDLPDGALHHWRASVLIRGVTLDALLAELQSHEGWRHAQADVLQWRLLARRGETMRVFIKMRREEIVTAVYNTEHDVRYERHGASGASSRSRSLRIAEVQQIDEAREREAPEGRDRGFLWRMNSYWRYQQRSDGVVVQVESLTLSRRVPSWLSPLATPLINRVARESLVRTLEAIRLRMRRDVDPGTDGLTPTVGRTK
ncbi:MAG: GtrA family protein [Vicinamibacterales bacterium]